MNSELVRATNHLNIGKGQCNGWIEQPEEIKSGIYCWTCKANGKRYIGQSGELQRRKRVFLNFSRYHYGGVRINNARHKYNSRKMWEYSIIEYCSADNLDEREIAYITANNTTQQGIGYNLSSGGGGASLRGELNPRWGVKLSDEIKQKMSEANSIPVNQYDLDGNFIREWQSATTAAKELGLNKSNINSCCCGRAKSAGQYLWSYATEVLNSPYQTNNEKPIYQIDINSGEIIGSYDRLTDAATKYNIDISSISATCRGEMNYYKGYIWIFQSDFTQDNIIQRQRLIMRYRPSMLNDETIERLGGRTPRKKRARQVRRKTCNIQKKPVNQYTTDGEFVRRWGSATEAEVYFKGKKTTFINKVLKGIKPTAYGYKWEYAV